jgi:putative hydrolase of the HAD superfamily
MIEVGTKAVYFDAVGTLLFPSQPVARTYAEFARRLGIEVDVERFPGAFREAFARQERLDSQNNWRTDEARERARWRAIVGELISDTASAACFEELWAWYGKPEAWKVNQEFAEVSLDLTRRGLIVGVASNFDSRLNTLVTAMPELARFRDRCVISSLTGWRKPAHEFFAAVVHDARCSAEHILYVGDDPRNDMDGAVSAGFSAILYDPLDRAEGRNRVRSLRDLLTV